MPVSERFAGDLFGPEAQIERGLELPSSAVHRRQIIEGRRNLRMFRSQSLLRDGKSPFAQPLRLGMSSLACVDGGKAIESLGGGRITLAQYVFTNLQGSSKLRCSFVEPSLLILQDGQVM